METAKIAATINEYLPTETSEKAITQATAFLENQLQILLGYHCRVVYRYNAYSATVNCFNIKITADGDELALSISTTRHQDVGLDEPLEYKEKPFNLNWDTTYANFKKVITNAHESQSIQLIGKDNYFIRSSSGLKVQTTGFSGGMFGTAVNDSATELTGRPNYFEAVKLAKDFSTKLGTNLDIVTEGQRKSTPFWEFNVNHNLAPQVTEIIENGSVLYQLWERGVKHTYKVVEHTMFGDDVHVDKAYCLENELTFNQGVASYATDVISRYINRKARLKKAS